MENDYLSQGVMPETHQNEARTMSETKRKSFFELANRLRNSQDRKEGQLPGDQLERLIFGS